MPKKPNLPKDPHAAREAKKYDKPIASRELILEYLEKKGRAVSFKNLEKRFTANDSQRTDALRRRLGAMVRDGQLLANRRGSYVIAQQLDLVAGRVDIARDGYGFLIPDKKGADDIFLPAREVSALMPGDRVLVRPIKKPGERKVHGVVAEVIERCRTKVVGRYLEEKGICLVSPLDRRIPQDVIVQRVEVMPLPGEYVLVELLAQPGKRQQSIGRIVEVLGDAANSGMEVEIAIREHGLPHEWPPGIDAELKAIGDQIDQTEAGKRKDLRSLPFVTIDGEDAKDFDDAVYASQNPDGGWVLQVAIADVSHYVKPGSVLDDEGQNRTTSVYFPGSVIPMLPEQLSNGLCSLRPDEDRLVLVAKLDIDAQGRLQNTEVFKSVIRSHARLTYTKVAQVLETQDTSHARYKELTVLSGLFDVLNEARAKRGAIEFESRETKIHFNDDGKIDVIKPVVRNKAHRIIEECMLIANVAVAEYLRTRKAPIVYRVHPTPALEQVKALREGLVGLGLSLGGGEEPHAKDYTKVLNQAKGRKDETIIQTKVLRSLPPAVYQTQPDNHFGLAYDHYVHFTSPIRRYPDLLIHRALVASFDGKEAIAPKEGLNTLAARASENERRADLAARDATDWLKCHFMLDKIGEVHTGKISAVTSFGVFVTLKDIYVEGLVHITALKNDYYTFEPEKMRLVGRKAGMVYQLGDEMQVRVVRVDLDERNIDLALETH